MCDPPQARSAPSPRRGPRVRRGACAGGRASPPPAAAGTADRGAAGSRPAHWAPRETEAMWAVKVSWASIMTQRFLAVLDGTRNKESILILMLWWMTCYASYTHTHTIIHTHTRKPTHSLHPLQLLSITVSLVTPAVQLDPLLTYQHDSLLIHKIQSWPIASTLRWSGCSGVQQPLHPSLAHKCSMSRKKWKKHAGVMKRETDPGNDRPDKS